MSETSPMTRNAHVTTAEAESGLAPHVPEARRLSNGKRFLIAAGICLVVIGVLAGTKFAQISGLIRAGEAAQAAGPPPEAVATDVAKGGTWDSVFDAVGSVAAARGVTISNESPGVVRAIRFESGAMVRAGQVLVELDAAVERAQLASLKARLELAASNAQRTRNLTETGAYTKAQLDTDEAQLKTVTADVGALQAQIDRKVVRAPFAGKLGIRSVNLGQYLNPGTPITMLESLEAVFVDFTLPQQELARVPVGAPTRIVLPGTNPPRTLEGKIAAVDPTSTPPPAPSSCAPACRRDGPEGRAAPRHVRQRVGAAARAGERGLRPGHGDRARALRRLGVRGRDPQG